MIKRILVIDDDEIDAIYVERELVKLNLSLSIHRVRDGVEALDLLVTQDKTVFLPEIIILDLMMPRMNGLEFLKALRSYSQFNELIIFVLTTSNNNKDKICTQNYGIDGYFVKDTEFKEFIKRCNIVLQTS
jgi:DNA-binding response OmpR family regulator